MVEVPRGFTECEAYRGFVIAVRNGVYCGFGVEMDTRNGSTREEVRRRVDALLD